MIIDKENIVLKSNSINYIFGGENPNYTFYSFDIFTFTEDLDDFKIGKIELIYIQDLDDTLILDEFTEADYFSSLYEDNIFKEELSKYDFATIDSLLILNKVQIDKEYRKNNIGYISIYGALKYLQAWRFDCPFVLNAFPLQFTGNVNKDNEEEFLNAQDKLVRYYEVIGFEKPFKDDGTMITNPSYDLFKDIIN